jgi:hypothetical protein
LRLRLRLSFFGCRWLQRFRLIGARPMLVDSELEIAEHHDALAQTKQLLRRVAQLDNHACARLQATQAGRGAAELLERAGNVVQLQLRHRLHSGATRAQVHSARIVERGKSNTIGHLLLFKEKVAFFFSFFFFFSLGLKFLSLYLACGL